LEKTKKISRIIRVEKRQKPNYERKRKGVRGKKGGERGKRGGRNNYNAA
jgi:hypothetical protein